MCLGRLLERFVVVGPGVEMQARYSIGTWDTDEQAYRPQEMDGQPWLNITLLQLRQAMRHLQEWGYSCHRYKTGPNEHDDNDWAVLIERTDGMNEADIFERWKR